MRQAVRYIGHITVPAIVGVAAFFTLAACPGVAWAQGNVVLAVDPLFINGASGGLNPGRFNYSNTFGPAPDVGRYKGYTISEPGSGGSGLGINLNMLYNSSGQSAINTPIDTGTGSIPVTSANLFPLLDRGTFGASFDPSQYVAELRYKPLTGNTAAQLNLTLEQSDGYINGNNSGSFGNRAGEQWQWGWTDLINKYNSGTKDADGFVTVLNNGGSMSQAASFYHGPSYMYNAGGGSITGDNLPDFNNFEGDFLKVSNGVPQITLQTSFDNASPVDNWEIKSVVVRKINPDPREMARLDSHSGLSGRFGAPFQTDGSAINVGGTDYFVSNTDQVSRFDQNGFTPLTVKTTTDSGVGGIALLQPPNYVVFDGTNATVDVTAKLTVAQGAGQADHIVLVVKNMSGNDDAAGSGGDEYHFNLPLSSFNTSTMTTVSVPLNTFTKQQSSEFTNPGNGLLSGFHLYYLGLNTDPNVGLVNMAIDSIRVMLPGVQGDYNGNGIVDTADYTVWRDHLGQTFTLPNRSTLLSGPIGQGDYDFWKSRFGAISGAGAAGAVPEPATWLLGLMAMCGLAAIRRRS